MNDASQHETLRSTVLPNGQRVFHLNHSETRYLYDEIFVTRAYTPPGFAPDRPNPTVLDVGANIGLFALFAVNQWPGARVYAFEPVPETFRVLKANTSSQNVQALEVGIGRTSHLTTMFHYPRYSIISGRHADPARDSAVVRTYLENVAQQLDDTAHREAVLASIDEILAGRFDRTSVPCQIETLSDMIRISGLSRIDLLKIDIERDELDAVLGIDDSSWDLIDRMVVEIDDQGGELAKISDLARAHGMVVRSTQLAPYQGTGLHMLYAMRP